MLLLKCKVLVKGRAGHVHVRKASGGNGGSTPLIINFGSKWTWMVSITIEAL